MLRSLLPFAAAAALAVGTAACSDGKGGTSLPFTAPPDGSGGTTGVPQPGATSTGLLRLVQGSPDRGVVDFCVDQTVLGVTAAGVGSSVAYGSASPLFAIPGGIAHTIAAYPTTPAGAGGPGAACATAPGPYFGEPPLATTVIAPGVGGNPARETVVLGGTSASGTLGFYVFGEPSFAAPPAGSEAIAHDAAPAFSAAAPAHAVGFGAVATTGTALPGAADVAPARRSGPDAATVNVPAVSPLASIPASFFAGAGNPAGAVVPLATAPAPAPAAGQPYVAELYALDAPAGGLRLLALQADRGLPLLRLSARRRSPSRRAPRARARTPRAAPRDARARRVFRRSGRRRPARRRGAAEACRRRASSRAAR